MAFVRDFCCLGLCESVLGEGLLWSSPWGTPGARQGPVQSHPGLVGRGNWGKLVGREVQRQVLAMLNLILLRMSES